jgi:(2Fe-2S) ferredoxin
MPKKKGKKTKKTGTLATLAKPDAKVRDYDAHVLVCKGGDCKKRGSKEVQKALKGELRAAGMNRDVRIDSVECLGLCKHGPNVVVYPSGTWYLGVIEGDATEIVEGHLRDGEPVEHLAAEIRPRKK